jgi:hypothetical protein
MCSNCPNEFRQGKACNECSKLFCKDHELNTCPFCGGELRAVSIDVEKKGILEIDWLVIEGTKLLAVTEVNLLPSYFMKLWVNLRIANSPVIIVLFATKQKSIEFEKILHQTNGMAYRERVFSERSRYSIFYQDKDHPYYLLLNQQYLTESTAIFLTNFNIKMYAKINANNKIFDTKQKEIIISIGEILFNYNKKMCIPFVSAGEEIQTLITNLANNVKQDYFEAITLQELLVEPKYSNDIGEYLRYKIEAVFKVMDFEARFIMLEVFQNLERILHINSLLASISANTNLSQFLKNCYMNEYGIFKKKYAEMPDLLRASDYINSNQSKFDFSNYDEFAEGVARVIKGAFSEIEARYVSLTEGVDLLKLSDFFLGGLEKNQFIIIPNIGTINGYVELLKRIFNKDGIYPEVRIIAGYALEHTLLSWLMIDRTQKLFEEYIECTRKLSQLIESNLSEILEKRGSIGEFQGSSLKYDDAAQKLLTASKIARSFGDKVVEREFATLAEDIAVKYNLGSVKIAIWWSNFVDSQNFSYLEKIHNSMDEWDKEQIAKLNYLAVPIGLLADSLLHHDLIDQHIDQAQKEIMDAMPIGATLQTSASAGLRTSESFYHILEMFKQLLKYQGKNDEIKKAYYSALVLDEVILPSDPLRILSLKTKIVFHLLNQNIEQASQFCSKLSTYNDPEGCIRQFLEIAVDWIHLCLNNEERKYIYKNQFQYKGKDIWIQTLQIFIIKTMDEDLSINIAGSKAVIFVEGITDLLVYTEFIKKLYPQEKIYFFDLEGYSNHEYYTESKIIKELKIPAYLIFDGDTRDDKKKIIIRDIAVAIRPNHIYTLQKNSVENYLLNSRAITEAFPKSGSGEENIKRFIEKTLNKKNKKLILQHLFQKFNMGKYNKESAKQIASKFEIDEISSELRELLTNIVQIKNV